MNCTEEPLPAASNAGEHDATHEREYEDHVQAISFREASIYRSIEPGAQPWAGGA